MKKFEKNIDDRKVLVARISQLTGQESHYTRVPRCAYEIGAFTVEKDGSLTVEEGADETVLQTLISENMIGACIEEAQAVSQEAEQPAAGTAQIRQPELGTEDWGEDDGPEAGSASRNLRGAGSVETGDGHLRTANAADGDPRNRHN